MKSDKQTKYREDESLKKIEELTLELKKTVKKAGHEASKEIELIMKQVDQKKLANLRNKKY